MTADELLDDLDERLRRATSELNRLAWERREEGDTAGAIRTDGKAQGIALARDYLRSYR